MNAMTISAVLVGSVAALLLTAGPACAGQTERVDLYDTTGRRTGYAIVDRESGRVDYFDVGSRRTGFGTVDSTGRAERFDVKGRRQDGTVLPPAPKR
jgi:hypothetical protein